MCVLFYYHGVLVSLSAWLGFQVSFWLLISSHVCSVCIDYNRHVFKACVSLVPWSDINMVVFMVSSCDLMSFLCGFNRVFLLCFFRCKNITALNRIDFSLSFCNYGMLDSWKYKNTTSRRFSISHDFIFTDKGYHYLDYVNTQV